jgi:hypothetical protein
MMTRIGRQLFARSGSTARGATAQVDGANAGIRKNRTTAKMETLGEPPLAP